MCELFQHAGDVRTEASVVGQSYVGLCSAAAEGESLVSSFAMPHSYAKPAKLS